MAITVPYLATKPIVYANPNLEPVYVVGLIIKPEAQRLLAWFADQDHGLATRYAGQVLQSYGFEPLLFKTILEMNETVLLNIYAETYKPYLDRLQVGTHYEQQCRQKQVDFFCKKPITLVLSTLTRRNVVLESEAVAIAQEQRDQLRTTLGKSHRVGNRIVHRQTTFGSQFSMLHAGFLHEVQYLIDNSDVDLLLEIRPNALNIKRAGVVGEFSNWGMNSSRLW